MVSSSTVETLTVITAASPCMQFATVNIVHEPAVPNSYFMLQVLVGIVLTLRSFIHIIHTDTAGVYTSEQQQQQGQRSSTSAP
jgi:hypothetical protein